MTSLSILGSTGSIGRSALDVVRHSAGRFSVSALAARSCSPLLCQQIREFGPGVAALENPAEAARLKEVFPALEVREGPSGVASLAEEGDTVLLCVVGIAGLDPAMRAIRAKKRLALATKEVLVAGGEIVMAEARRLKVPVLPVDSEHSAIFQCLQAVSPGAEQEAGKVAKKLLITASGGPFWGRKRKELEKVTPDMAMNHPVWKMGPKISVDSATMMNKGLEVIEAARLFRMPAEKIEVVVHPQSLVHSLVEFQDGAMMAQLSSPDMRLAIQYALTFPERTECPIRPLDLVAAGKLEFLAPDLQNFPCLGLAFEALKMGGLAPAVLNGANEAAVALFLEGRISFLDIPKMVEKKLSNVQSRPLPSLEEIFEADRWARLKD